MHFRVARISLMDRYLSKKTTKEAYHKNHKIHFVVCVEKKKKTNKSWTYIYVKFHLITKPQPQFSTSDTRCLGKHKPRYAFLQGSLYRTFSFKTILILGK